MTQAFRTRPWRDSVLDGALFALLTATLAVPLGFAAAYLVLGAPAALLGAYLYSLARGRPFKRLDYAPRDFALFFTAAVLLVYPFWAAMFMLLLGPMAHVHSWLK